MKKLALLLASVVLTFASCTKDDSPAAAPLLLKTITNGDKVTTLTYDGNKIVTIGSETYTYTGDLITQKEATQNGIYYKFQYAYENGKLISELMGKDSGPGTTKIAISQKDYTYNPDGTVTAQKFKFKNGKIADGTSKITIENGNIIKIEDFYADGTSSGGAIYQYDNKINPLPNIKGYDKLLDPIDSSKNNFTNSYERNIDDAGLATYTTTRVFTYNDKGYPLTIQSTSVSSYDPGNPVTTTRVFTY